MNMAAPAKKYGLVSTKGPDGKIRKHFVDRERFDKLENEMPIVPEQDYETAMFEGGARLKILIASANLGNAPVNVPDMDTWVPRHAPHTDIVVFGLQECTYGQTGMDEVNGGLDPESLQALTAEIHSAMKEDDSAGGGSSGKKPTVARSSSGEGESEEEEDEEEEEEDEEAEEGVTTKRRQDTTDEKVSGAQHLLMALSRQLGPDFELVDGIMRGQMRLRVYIRRSLRREVSGVELGAENTGLGGVIANKGGQAVKLVFRSSTSLVFLNAHLAAHEGARKCHKRNADAREIFGGIRFGDRLYDLTQFDHVFWSGDLNYRLDRDTDSGAQGAQGVHGVQGVQGVQGADTAAADTAAVEAANGNGEGGEGGGEGWPSPPPPPPPAAVAAPALEGGGSGGGGGGGSGQDREAFRVKVQALIEGDELAQLARYDELLREVRAGRVFANFKTPPTDFKPTFKVERCVETVYNPKRLPSYTDRVLVKSQRHLRGHVGCHAYRACHAFSTSDHKPIIGRFSVVPTSPVEVEATPPFRHPTQGFSFYPQLKFFELRGSELLAMDEGFTLQHSGKQRHVESIKEFPTAHAKRPSMTDRGEGRWGIGAAKSDPYVLCRTLPAGLSAHATPPRTKARFQTLDPAWEDAPVLSLRAKTFDQLKHGSVVLSVFDYDAGKKDECIGDVCFAFEELAAAFASPEGVLAFSRDIVFKGNVRGALHGKVEVNIPPPGQFQGQGGAAAGAAVVAAAAAAFPFPHASRCVSDAKATDEAPPPGWRGASIGRRPSGGGGGGGGGSGGTGGGTGAGTSGGAGRGGGGGGGGGNEGGGPPPKGGGCGCTLS